MEDFFLSAYTSPMCLEILRRNATHRAMELFAGNRPEWDRQQFAAAQILCSGIEYATLMTVGDPVSLEIRVSAALDNILHIYGIPREIREDKIRRVFDMDQQELGLGMARDFREYVARTHEQALRDLLKP